MPLDENKRDIPEWNQKIVEQAKSFIGSKDWSLYSSKTSYDGKAFFDLGEYECNLFIYDVSDICGIKMDLPNEPGRFRGKFIKSKRPYVAR